MFRKRKEVHTLQNDCAAWNVDGSSTCKILFSSWISFWESKTGTSRGICSFSSCNKTAEIGGHVWLKRKGPHIAPICSGCNYHKNVKRMQSSDGQHSFIKKGTTVVKVEFTEDMKNAVRRIAVNDKDMDDIDDESTNEESDESRDEESDESDISWVADSLFESPSSHRQRGMVSTAFSRRSCVYCGVDISDRPVTHDRCLSCFRTKHYL